MDSETRGRPAGAFGRACRALFAALLLGTLFHQINAHALTVTVTGSDGVAITNYRWLVEEDATKHVTPGQPAGAGSQSLGFHVSHMPVVASGRAGAQASGSNLGALALDPAKHYFLSVLPDDGYQVGGVPIKPGQAAASMVVNKLPVPTGQMAIFVFEDNNPVNNAPEVPQERGLGGFNVLLTEGGGTYGQSGGQVTLDAFGNPIGSTYQQDAGGNFIYNTPGDPLSGPVVDVLGRGFVTTGADGMVIIKNLVPAKYGVQVVPPAGTNWQQTTTIEGAKTIDAWLKPNEPPFLVEFGPPFWHAFFGFVQPFNAIPGAPPGAASGTISGRVVNQHMSNPWAEFTFFPGEPVPECWVALNEILAPGRGLYAAPCNPDSTFSIPNVPTGLYQLAIWDTYLDVIINLSQVEVPITGGAVALGDVQVFNWFHRQEHRVFFDTNENGFPDAGEPGIRDMNINLRFRDGSIYQSFATDQNGVIVFPEVFPFFHWLVSEVDFARFKATGATIAVDQGGPIPPDNGWLMPSFGRLNPQLQSENAFKPYRTETGPVLLEGFQGFLGQTTHIEWGKNYYGPGQNGGITGIVHYTITRAEDDPRLTAAENWEPGVPRVQVALYRDCNHDNIPDKPNCTPATPTAPATGINSSLASVIWADIDNYPLGWGEGTGPQGPEDRKRNGNAGFSMGDAYDVGWTDSWDDALPSGCQGDPFIFRGGTFDCFDGLRAWNQVRPALFDGGYAFGAAAGKPELPTGWYIVESVAAPGYQTQKEEDKNVDFGDVYTPSPLALPAPCVGDPHTVPAELTLFPGVPSAFAGQTRPLCDRKSVEVTQDKNAWADFFWLTETPAAGHIAGFTASDTTAEFSNLAPNFGEKYAPPHVPVSLRDWTGREFSRIYADEFGYFNALVPSTYTINPPYPSGVGPNMVVACINSPGPIPGPNGSQIIDPFFNPAFTQTCYTFQYLPGKTTYLDTPVLPVAAFAGPAQFPLDCQFENGMPLIHQVTSNFGLGGPYVPATGGTTRKLTIQSAGLVSILNPRYDGTAGSAKTIRRDFGFGATAGKVTLNGTQLPIDSWSDGAIVASVPAGAVTGQLMVTKANGRQGYMGLTVTVGGPAPTYVTPAGSIQAAIDAANPGDLILVQPGVYQEMVVMHKRVRLQGYGAPATTILAFKSPVEKVALWRDKVTALVAAGAIDLLPGQFVGPHPPNNGPTPFNTEEGAGILVAPKTGAFSATPYARIDGIGITGADTGGGIMVNGYADHLEIGNNKLLANSGFYGGGIRVGHPLLVDPAANPQTDLQNGGYTDARNTNLHIHHNQVVQNGGLGVGGGGITLATGSHNYQLNRNFVCGNFSGGSGGGIAHTGLSDGGLISHNKVVFNQSLNQGLNIHGGGIVVAGRPPLPGATVSPGAGNVTVDGNLIQGNIAEVGDGGGIRAESVNGLDIRRSPATSGAWYQLLVTNNMVTNNIAGLAGGGIALQNVVKSKIVNNTIAHNDSTATSGLAFSAANPNQSVPQPAGIVSRAHTAGLNGLMAPTVEQRFRAFRYSNPTLHNNVVWKNRAFYWRIDNTTNPASFGLAPDIGAGAAAVYWDLAVLGAEPTDLGPPVLHPEYSILTDRTGYSGTNHTFDPQFVASYSNGDNGVATVTPGAVSSMATGAAFDEGGNWINVRFGPHTLTKPCNPAIGCAIPYGDYHLKPTSPALAKGNAATAPDKDFDGQVRTLPAGSKPDIGADERN